ncbi:glycosyl transferase [Virgisporangium aliadipatigenens]|uniref:Glycosyl transferase n=1 Tax=Virgisporangium aliadipatigenens TaxID=741659 RepID=A0A8J3YPI7_9ACTN|nr:glycosyltransferase [Virgisporangium aliadipatigenens]GIJ48112.1 glycosyl transferase [Virgisporangium aliadipatigenens]
MMAATTAGLRVRLAIVSPYPPRQCAVSAYTQELVRALAVAAPQITVSLWSVDSTPVADHRPDVAGVIPAADLSGYRRAAQKLIRIGADAVLVVHEPGPHARHLLGLTAELTRAGVPYLIAPHELRWSVRPDQADTIAALCREAAGVVVLSEAAEKLVLAARMAPPERIAVIPYGVPPELTRPPSSDVDVRPELAYLLADRAPGPLLVTTGPVHPGRGVDVAVATLPLLVRRFPGIRYVVAGADDDLNAPLPGARYRAVLRRAAAARGIDERLHLLDAALAPPETALLLHAASVAVLPDLDPGITSSAPLVDALAAGLPVVTTAHPFARETSGRAPGHLVPVPPANPEALAEAVGDVLDKARRRHSPNRETDTSVTSAEHLAGLVHFVLLHRRHAGRTTGARATHR